MKYILILLISFAFGQGIIFEFEYTDAEKEYYMRQQPITFGDILDYAEECYSDSIQVGWNYYFENDTVYSVPIDALLSYDSTRGDFIKSDALYTRIKTTPTFLGFIEWYERKIK